MTAWPGSFRSAPATSNGLYLNVSHFALALVVCAISAHASAQTTAISGTVYDPRTTASALPLPNVLVYVTTVAVPPLPSGVQCLTYAAPTGAIAYTFTGVDGSFTLKNVPVNSKYTLVIQAGKWRRQFSQAVDTVAITGLSLHMPSNHLEGDIPMIAIATGSADGVECVLHDMGIADSEFTDDTGTTNPGGHIHLYQGSASTGAYITPSTPSDTDLTGNMSTLNGYDMVMFPCQGRPDPEADTALANIVNYANAGGRVFTTHYSYVWLDPNAPYNSQFPPVANWNPTFTDPTPDPGTATINTGFTDGATLAQWLQNAGATNPGQPDQIQISTLRHDIDSIIPPTQSWLTLNDTADGNPVMQLTFNTPVSAPAAQQCGRVMFNEYHVKNLDGAGVSYPGECPTGPMNAQEEMLEYALFDLSAFVQPVVVPTLSVTFNPSPLIVKQNDAADEVTINITNTSTNAEIDPSATLSLTLPAGITATAMTDSTNVWNCTLSTLKCTRATSIPSTVSDPVTLTVSVGAYPAGGLASSTGVIKATVSSPTFSNDVTATDTVIFQQKAPVSWATPAPIIYGTALGGAQLDATSTVPGAFAYTPAIGTVLAVGQYTLSAAFTPTDETDYSPATATVTLTVVPAVPAITVAPTPNPAFLSNAVTITATIPSPAGTPTGTVAFYDGETQLGSSALNSGTAAFTTSALTMGTHAITAVYSGDANYQSSRSLAMMETIQDFTIAVAPASAGAPPTVYPGGSAEFSLVVSPLGGATMAGALSLSADGLPPTATVEFSPAVVAANSGSTSITMNVKTPALASTQSKRNPLGNGAIPMALGLVLLPFASRLRKARQRWIPMVLLSIAGAAFALGLTGCGGGVTYTPRSFTITVGATSGNLSHITTVKIKVE
jgi:hypothetical protein